MPYPNTPFDKNFNLELIWKPRYDISTNLNDRLAKTLQWLCAPPNLTSIRVNTLKYNTEFVVNIIRQYFENSFRKPNTYVHEQLKDVIIVENWKKSDIELITYEKEVIVDSLCGAAVARGAHIYAPGVLAMTSGCKVGDLVSIYVDISGNCRKGLQKLYNDPSKIYLGNGIAKMVRYNLYGDFLPQGLAVEVTETVSRCPQISYDIFPKGCAILQNLPSIICVHVLNPQPGETVLDMCAAPGNKTTHIATLMKNEGVLIAIDKTPRKLAILNEQCTAHLSNCRSYQYDATKIYQPDSTNNGIVDGPPFAAESFDKILLDAPCSALGQRPQFRNKISEKVLTSYVPLQKKLFQNAVHLLKVNGTLVYSTCTITSTENEGIVAWALKTFVNLRLIKGEPHFGEPGLDGTALTENERVLVQRFGPDSNVDSVGFFIACFVKIMLPINK